MESLWFLGRRRCRNLLSHQGWCLLFMVGKGPMFVIHCKEFPSLAYGLGEEARNGSEIGSDFLSELADGDSRRLGVNLHGGGLCLKLLRMSLTAGTRKWRLVVDVAVALAETNCGYR